jgi:hypothetical protein
METVEILANCCHVYTVILHFLFHENMFWEQRMLLRLKLNWLHGWTLNFCRMKFSKFRCEWIWVLCMKANYMIIGTQWHRLPLWNQKVSCLHCGALQWYCVILGTTESDFHYEVWQCYVCTRVHYNDFLLYAAHQVFLWVSFVWFEDFRTVKTDVMVMWIWHLVVWWVGNSVSEEHTALNCPEVRGWIFLSLIGYHLWDCMSCSRQPHYELWILSSSDILT